MLSTQRKKSLSRCPRRFLGLLLFPFLSTPVIAGTDQLVFNLVRTIQNPNLGGSSGVPDRFGSRFKPAGERLVVGDPFEDVDSIQDCGRVFVFTPLGANGFTTLGPLNPGREDHFGESLAWLGDHRVAIGAPQRDNLSSDDGIVHIYDITNGQYLDSISSPSPAASGGFGSWMDTHNGMLLIGAPGEQEDGVPAGKAYLINPNTKQVVATYHSPTPSSGDRFGIRVLSVDEDYVLISADLDDAPTSDSGVVHLFEGTSGDFVRTIQNPTPSSGDRFGLYAATLGDRVLVGALHDNNPSNDSGAAHLFDVETGNLERSFAPPEPRTGGFFGVAAAFNETAFIGAPFSNPNGGSSGAAYFFDSDTGAEIGSLLSPSPSSNDNFGHRLEQFDSSSVAVSAFGNGRVYLYRLANQQPTTPNVRLEPEFPFTYDDLICHASGSVDPEGEPVTLNFAWYADGDLIEFDGVHSVTGPSLHHSYTTRDQIIQCRVRPFDGEFFGAPGTDSVTILNSPPTTPIIQLLPENPTPADGLAVIIEDPYPTDADGDTVLPIFEWYESSDGTNWTRRPELSGGLTPEYDRGEPEISGLYTQFAEYWRVDVSMVDFAPEPAGFTKGATDPGTVTPPVTTTVYVLPDLNNDDQVDALDLTLLLESWGKNRLEVDPTLRPYLFESGAPLSDRVGPNRLLGLSQEGWQQGLEP